MNLLIDTHILLWWLADSRHLSTQAKKMIGDMNNLVFVSAATIWEIMIKKGIGKLDAPDDIEAVLKDSAFNELSITFQHALKVKHLPNHHQDPFDRILIAQSMCERLILITADEKFTSYPFEYYLV